MFGSAGSVFYWASRIRIRIRKTWVRIRESGSASGSLHKMSRIHNTDCYPFLICESYRRVTIWPLWNHQLNQPFALSYGGAKGTMDESCPWETAGKQGRSRQKGGGQHSIRPTYSWFPFFGVADPDPGLQTVEKKWINSCFDQLDVISVRLAAFPRAFKSLIEI